ncbi:Glucitol operon repressor [compost metagenome]
MDKVFLSCKGVHLQRGVSESNELQARIKQKMVEIADEVILLADSSKFGQQALTHVTDLSRVNTIVTDQGIHEDILAGLKERSITVTTV